MTMHNALKLVFVKAGINVLAFLANKVLPQTNARYPQTQILGRVFQRLREVYRVERRAGRRGLEDEHFQHLLDATWKALAFISEEDRYYRQWLGLVYLLIEEELEAERDAVSRDEFVRLAREQWHLNWSVIGDGVYEAEKARWFPVLLTDFLHNLV
jgi:hypothetical protein